MEHQTNSDLFRKYASIGLLLLILFTAFTLRFHDLAEESLENDELSSWVRSADGNFADVVDRTVKFDVHPPAYYFFLNIWIQAVGDSEFALRFPAAVFGIVAVWLIYLLGKRLYSKREALIAAALMAVMLMPIFFSQMVRSYSLLLSLMILLTLILLSLIREHQHTTAERILLFIAYTITGIAISYVHYFGLFILLSHFIFLLIYHFIHKRHLSILLSYVLMALAYLPWLPMLLLQIRQNSLSHVQTPNIFFFAHLAYFILNRSIIVCLIVLALFLAILLKYRDLVFKSNPVAAIRKFFGIERNGLLIVLLLGPIVISLIISLLSRPNATLRNFIVLLPALYLFASRLLSLLFDRVENMYPIILTILLLGISSLVFDKDYYGIAENEQFREAVHYVATIDRKGVLPVVGYAWYPGYFRYYFDREGIENKPDAMAGGPDDIRTFDEFVDAQNSPVIWYIFGHKIPDPDFMAHLKSRFEITRSKFFNNAGVLLLQRRTN